MTTGDRAGAVADRLEGAARDRGIDEAATHRLRATLNASLARRAERFADPHHPDFLHPARTALVLLHDTPLADAAALGAALLLDTEDPACGFAVEEARTMAGDDAAAILAEVPVPASAGDRLLEQLITAGPSAQLVALAERLDHARHLHLHPTERWPGFHADVVEAYLPVADRADETLARRFRWWADHFARRYLLG